MIPTGNFTFAQTIGNQGSDNNNTTKNLESSSMLLATTYDFENPMYAKEGLIAKLVRTVKRFANR